VTAESPASQSAGSVPALVAPSRFVQTVIRPMTKVLNPLIVKLAAQPRDRADDGCCRLGHHGLRQSRARADPSGLSAP
jgi:hypothetical protein